MIEVENISFGYGSRQILRGVSLQVAAGDMVALMGANGAGKTTLLRCIAGLLQPQGGHVRLDGRPVGEYKSRERAQKVALVGQHLVTDFEFTVRDRVLMARTPYQLPFQPDSAQDIAIAEEAMRQTSVLHLQQALPHELSGGELRRTMIACALAQQTPVMLLDEPLSNLDIAHQFEVMRLLAEINKQHGKTIVIILHDLNMALRFCPKLLLLHEGDVAYYGDTRVGLTEENVRRVFGIGMSDLVFVQP